VPLALQREFVKAFNFNPGKFPPWLGAGLSVLLFSADVLATGAVLRDPRASFFIQTFGDLQEELKTARVQGKQGILLFFEADGCRFCTAMRKGVLSRLEVQDWYRDRFVSIAIDIHGDVEITDLDGVTLPEKMIAEQRRVFLTPTVSFIDLEGAEVYRHVGLVKSVDEFLAMGEYVAGKHYFDTEFPVYAGSRGVRIPADSLVTPAEESPK